MIYSVIKEEKSLTEIFKEYDIDIDFEPLNEGLAKNIIADIKKYIIMLIHKIEEFIDNIVFSIKKKFLVNQSFLKKNRDKIIIGNKLFIDSNDNTTKGITYYNIKYIEDIMTDLEENIKSIEDDIVSTVYNVKNGKNLKDILKNKKEEILDKLKKENLETFVEDFDNINIDKAINDTFSEDIKYMIRYKRDCRDSFTYLANRLNSIFTDEKDSAAVKEIYYVSKEYYNLIIKVIKTDISCLMSNYISNAKFAMQCIKLYDKEKNEKTDNFEATMHSLNIMYNYVYEYEEEPIIVDDEPVDESASIFSNIVLI